MATELDVSKSRRFDIAMSRRTRRSTSLVACFQDQYTPSLAQHRRQELKSFLQCQDDELKAVQQCEDAEQKTLCLNEVEELKVPQAPLQCEDDEQKTPEQYEDEQEKGPHQYPHEEQEITDPYQDDEKDQYLEEEKTSEQYQDEDELPSQYQDQELVTPNLPGEDEKETASERLQNVELVTPNLPEEDEKETASERFQDVEQKELQQHQEEDEQASHSEDEEEQKSHQEDHDIEQKTPEQFQALKKVATPPRPVDNVPRFSLQELIQQKQLPTGEAMPTNKLGGRGDSGIADNMVSVSGSGAAAGGTTLAMVIKRPEGGKKSMGMIRRCVKALNQMIKAKHGSKKNLHF